MKTLFLILAALVTILSVVPYLRDILKGTTKPNLVSWTTWTLLTGIATAAEIAAHEYITAIFTGSAVVETGLIVVFGLKYGYVKYTRFDGACQVAALAGIVLWQLFNSPVIGVMASVTIDFIGALPTFRHSWLDPGEETWGTYGLAALGGLLAILALTAYNWISLPYAMYIVGVNIALAGIIIYRDRRLI